MVCIPCIVIPALLWFYYRYLRPYMGPITERLETWIAPWTTKFLEYTGADRCPIKKRPDAGTRVKHKGSPSEKPREATAPPEEEDEGISIDSEEKLSKAVESGGFGANVAGLRQRSIVLGVPLSGEGDRL